MGDIDREDSLHRYEDKRWATPKRQWGAVSIFPTRQDDPKKVIRLPSRCNGSVIPTTSCLSTSWLLLEHRTYSGRRMKWRTSRARGIRVHDWNPIYEQEHEHGQELQTLILSSPPLQVISFSRSRIRFYFERRVMAQGYVFTLHLATRPRFGNWWLFSTRLCHFLTARIPFWTTFTHPF